MHSWQLNGRLASHRLASSCLDCRLPPPPRPPAGAAICLAGSSLLTLGGLAWSVGRALVPPAMRATADAAVVLASATAAALPFL